MRYLQLSIFFALVIASYHFLGSPLPRVASDIPAEIEIPATETVTPEIEALPTELPNE